MFTINKDNKDYEIYILDFAICDNFWKRLSRNILKSANYELHVS